MTNTSGVCARVVTSLLLTVTFFLTSAVSAGAVSCFLGNSCVPLNLFIESGHAVATPVAPFGDGLVATNLAGNDFTISLVAGLDANNSSVMFASPGQLITPFNAGLQTDFVSLALFGTPYSGSCASGHPICGFLNFTFLDRVLVPPLDVGPTFTFTSPFALLDPFFFLAPDSLLVICTADGNAPCATGFDLHLIGQGTASITYQHDPSNTLWTATETDYTFATPEPATLLLLGGVLPLTVALSREARGGAGR
jgi:hypothetical protein